MKQDYLILGLFVILFVNCSRTGNIEEIQYDESLLQVKVMTMQLITKAETAESQKLGTIALDNVADRQSYGEGVSGTYTLAGEAIKSIPLFRDEALIYAHQPYNQKYTLDATKIPLLSINPAAIEQQYTIATVTNHNVTVFDELSDYKYGVKYDATNSEMPFTQEQPTAFNSGNIGDHSAQVTIGLKHAFAQIKLVITNTTTLSADNRLVTVQLKRNIQTLTTNSVMNLKDGTILQTAVTNDESGYRIAFDNYTLPLNQPLSVNLLTIPDDARSYQVDLEFDGKLLHSNPVQDNGWKAGYIYTYPIEIKATGLSIAPVIVEEWKIGETIEKVEVY